MLIANVDVYPFVTETKKWMQIRFLMWRIRQGPTEYSSALKIDQIINVPNDLS